MPLLLPAGQVSEEDSRLRFSVREQPLPTPFLAAPTPRGSSRARDGPGATAVTLQAL